MEINYLLSLTVNEIERGVFPLRQLLENSLYYPAGALLDRLEEKIKY